MTSELLFDDYTSACQHFNINLGLSLDASLEEEIVAYQLLSHFLKENDLACEIKPSGQFEVKSKNG